jgi:hypothetical protein
LEALREGLQTAEAILHLRAALDGPQKNAATPEARAEAESVIQTLMDVMESNRRFRPAGTADLRPHIRRIYELVSTVAHDDGA